MKMYNTFFMLVIFISLSSVAQEKQKVLLGKVNDALGAVKDVHIINLNNGLGTFTNKDGQFKIFASIGDSLKISSVAYKTEIIKLKPTDFGLQQLIIPLKIKTTKLDEVIVNNHNLTGYIESDIKKTPKDRKAVALGKTMDFSNVDWHAPMNEDHIDKKVRPQVVETDPIALVAGVGGSIGIPFKSYERERALKRKIAFNTAFPKKILSELGEKFFFEELKIPIENYQHFLEYCNPLGIEKLYKENKLMEVITILRQEQKGYLKIIKKE